MRLTFKQHLESKFALKRAVDSIPRMVMEYTICKYCKLNLVDEDLVERQISLKPQTKILVEWSYENLLQPKPVTVMLDDDAEEAFTTQMTSEKMSKWLIRHTIHARPTVN